MKTDDERLSKRGFLAVGAEMPYQHIDSEQLLLWLASDVPIERTRAARVIAAKQDGVFIKPLIAALIVERKLYSKLGICDALVSFGEDSILPLTHQLGRIGSNQYKDIADKPFKKDSYPLPRDIAARTLIRIGVSALPALFDVVKNGGVNQISEAIDAVGFINFYENEPECFDWLESCYYSYEDNELIRWKIVRAMSGCTKAKGFLLQLQKVEQHIMFRQEIDRSLRLSER